MIQAPIPNQATLTLQNTSDKNLISSLINFWAKTFPDKVYKKYSQAQIALSIIFKKENATQQENPELNKLTKVEIERELLNYIKKTKKAIQQKSESTKQHKTKVEVIENTIDVALQVASLIDSQDYLQPEDNIPSIDSVYPPLIKHWLELFEVILHEANPVDKGNKISEKLAEKLAALASRLPMLYSSIAFYLLSPSLLSEINIFSAEHLIERANYWSAWVAKSVKPFDLHCNQLHQFLITVNKDRYNCAQARLALANNNIKKAEEYIALVSHEKNISFYGDWLIELYSEVFAYYEEANDIYKGLYTLYRMTKLRQIAGDKEASKKITQLSDLLLEIKKEKLNATKQALKNEFPNLNFKVKYQYELITYDEPPLVLYFPLEALPPAARRYQGSTIGCLQIVKLFDKEKSKNSEYTGIQIQTLSNSPDKIVDSIHNLLRLIYPERYRTAMAENNATVRAGEAAAASSLSASVKKSAAESAPSPLPASAACSTSSVPAKIVDDFEKLSINNASVKKREKQKNRHQPTPAAAPSSASPLSTKMTASHYGFTAYANAEITPIYPSKEAQKRRDPCIFVTLKQIDGASGQLLKKLNEMLNPTEEGIVTVGTYGEAGPKIWKYPGEQDWHRCALRFKFLGNLGKFRVIAEPEEKIEVNGKARYLFSLGYLKQK